MNACKVIGYKIGEFTDKKSGEKVTYGKLYTTSEAKDVNGLACEAFSVKPDMLSGIGIGDDVEILYNRYGRVESVVVV